MLVECEGAFEVLETELAHIELCQVGVVRRIGGGIPRLDLVRPKLDHLEVIINWWLGAWPLSRFS